MEDGYRGWLSVVGSSVRGMETLTHLDARELVPPLRRTVEGWAEPFPPACGCGSAQFLVGWTACSCGSDAVGPGHRTRECRRRDVLGCVAKPLMGPLDKYGCARRTT